MITEFTLDVGGLKQKAAAYVMPSAYNYDMILGKTWLEPELLTINPN